MVTGFFIANYFIILKEKFVYYKLTCIFAEVLNIKTNNMKTFEKFWDYISFKLFGNQKNIFRY